jgi:hypothetical protein
METSDQLHTVAALLRKEAPLLTGKEIRQAPDQDWKWQQGVTP